MTLEQLDGEGFYGVCRDMWSPVVGGFFETIPAEWESVAITGWCRGDEKPCYTAKFAK